MSAIRGLAAKAKDAAPWVATLDDATRSGVLRGIAESIEAAAPLICMMNAKDVQDARAAGLPEPKIARLALTPEAILRCAQGLRRVADMPDPVGRVVESRTLPSGLRVRRERTPLGVVACIYEARPLVTLDAFALCFKSGNACVLKGGREAAESNTVMMKFIQAVLTGYGLPTDACAVLPRATREEIAELVALEGLIDVVIPRGGEALIEFVRAHARVPVLAHARGVCHVYVDAAADLDMAERICLDAKASAPATCNAAECVLVHAGVAPAFVPRLVRAMQAAGVEVRACARARAIEPSCTPATPEDFGREHLGPVLSLRVVDDVDDAIAHIRQYGSDHTEAVVTADPRVAAWFTSRVRSACVLVNASTRLHDGFELGLGAEVGISTTRLHAYGAMGLEELTTLRWVVEGDGHLRAAAAPQPPAAPPAAGGSPSPPGETT